MDATKAEQMAEMVTQWQDHRTTEDKSNLCHAPFTSLYWGQTGKVVACCYNREFVLGQYPENSIHDIWTGKRAEALRKGMKVHSKLPKGCELCESQLCAGNFSGFHAVHFDMHAQAPENQTDLVPGFDNLSYPKIMEFELSNSCNLECVMCHGGFSSTIRKNREQLEPLKDPYDDAYVEQLCEFIPHLKEARFVGGEPFMVGVYYKIWEKFIELNPDIVCNITTNGSLMNGRIQRIVEGLNKPQMIMSIDSIVRETYDKIRINSDYDQVAESMKYYAKVCQSKGGNLSFATCPMTNNWHEIPDLVRHCNDEGHFIFFNTVVYPRFVALRTLSAAKLEEIIDFYRTQELPGDDSHIQGNNRAFEDLTNQIESWHREAVAREANPSSDGDFHWTVKPKDELLEEWNVSEFTKKVTEELENPAASPASARKLVEWMKEEAYDEWCFVRDYTYSVWLAWVDHKGLDAETAAELRLKLELSAQHYENFSNRSLFVERMLETEPRVMLENAMETKYDDLLYAPMRLFEQPATA